MNIAMLVPALLVTLLVVGLLARERWMFRILPMLADAKRSRGNKAGARRLLERLLKKPALFGARSRAWLHHRLAWYALEDGRTQDAVDHARRSLEGRHHPAIEALFRMRYADALEADGREAEAAAERTRASERLDSSKETAAHLLARGKALKRSGRYAESIPLFERAVAHTAGAPADARAQLLLNLALSCWEAGQVPKALRWADEAISLDVHSLTHRTTAFSVAALALGTMGRLDEAEQRWKQAYDLASGHGNTTQAARYLASLSMIQRRRGHLTEAMATCEQAAGMSIEARRMARTSQYETCMALGQFAEAREMLVRAAKAQGFPTVAAETRIQALNTMGQALAAAEGDSPQEALPLLQDVSGVLATDEKVAIDFYSVRTLVEAMSGLEHESRTSARAAAEWALRMGNDRGRLMSYHMKVGRAALLWGDIAEARAHFNAGMALGPDPVDQPKLNYFLGECSAADGDLTEAERKWQAAVDSGLNTYYTARAQQRLEQHTTG